jgi:hypothetical protein
MKDVDSMFSHDVSQISTCVSATDVFPRACPKPALNLELTHSHTVWGFESMTLVGAQWLCAKSGDAYLIATALMLE